MNKKILVIGRGGAGYGQWLASNIDDLNIVYIQNLEDLNAHIGSKPDLLFFIGGADVNPKYYTENLGKYTGINNEHDELDFTAKDMFPRDTPKLGICRGSQFLTVAAGGKLIQHVSNHTQSHPITTKGGSEYKITSTHHQMCYPFDVSGYKLLAWSTKFRSTTYLNGNNKETDLDIDFLEPEIMYYPNINALGIQGHPEFGNCPKETSNYCIKLVQKLLKGEL